MTIGQKVLAKTALRDNFHCAVSVQTNFAAQSYVEGKTALRNNFHCADSRGLARAVAASEIAISIAAFMLPVSMRPVPARSSAVP